ncbi:MAG: hypothetical protein KUL75_08850 [Sterolibacterium sp.]|nr:hypothetical protein [Sterolibacterium sp.]
MSNIENLILEHLKKIQTEQTASRERDAEIMSRLANIESGLARIARDESGIDNLQRVNRRSTQRRQIAGTNRTY